MANRSGVLARFPLCRTPEPRLGPVIGLDFANSQRIAWLNSVAIRLRILTVQRQLLFRFDDSYFSL